MLPQTRTKRSGYQYDEIWVRYDEATGTDGYTDRSLGMISMRLYNLTMLKPNTANTTVWRLQPADPKNLVSMSLFNSAKASNPTGVFWSVPFRSLIELPVPNVPRLHQPSLLDSVLVDRRCQCHGSQPCRKTASSHIELFLSRF